MGLQKLRLGAGENLKFQTNTGGFMSKISVIGAGTMGNGIAHVFAQHGFEVHLIDVSEQQLEKAIKTISKNLDRQVAKEIIRKEKKEETLLNIVTTTSIEEGVKNARLD